MTICEECRKSLRENAELNENFGLPANFERIIGSPEEDELEWHPRYRSGTIYFSFGMVTEEGDKCYVSFLMRSPVYRVAKFTENLEKSDVSYEIDSIHGLDEDGRVAFPQDFDSFEEFESETAGFGESASEDREGEKQENPMFG